MSRKNQKKVLAAIIAEKSKPVVPVVMGGAVQVEKKPSEKSEAARRAAERSKKWVRK